MTPNRALIAALVSLAIACTGGRELTLTIDSTAGVPCDIDRIRIRGTAAETTTVVRDLEGELPISVTLIDDTPDGSFMAEIAAYKDHKQVMRVAGELEFGPEDTTTHVLLSPACTPRAGCTLEDAIAAAADAPPSLARFECGPEVTRYLPSSPLDTFTDACALPDSESVLTDGDQAPVALESLDGMLPAFGFRFYGKPVHRIWVSKNGYISFGLENPDPDNTINPGPFDRDFRGEGAPPPQQSVLAFWDALTLRATGVCLSVARGSGGSVPERLLITWKQACLTEGVCVSDDLNFTVTLNAKTQGIDIHYGNMSASAGERAKGSTATVGLVNQAAGCRVSECTYSTGLCKDGVKPCGYSQVFSETVQPDGVRDVHFGPFEED